MATHPLARLAILLILVGATVAVPQSIAEPGAAVAPKQQEVRLPLAAVDTQVPPRYPSDEEYDRSESPPSPDGSVISNRSLVPHDRETVTCVTDVGENVSTPASPVEGALYTPTGTGPGSCDVLVVGGLVIFFNDRFIYQRGVKIHKIVTGISLC